MIAFLNELSLEDHTDWAAAFQLFWRVSSDPNGATMRFRDGHYFRSVEFAQRINPVLGAIPSDLRAVIRNMIFSDQNWRCWRPSRRSCSDDRFYCQPPGSDYSDRSICEGAENILQQNSISVAVVSACDSSFGTSDKINTTKQPAGESAELLNISTIESWQQWIATQRGHFDPTADEVPRDFQTVLLKDSARFRTTGKVERRFRRMVYEEVATGRLLYVDEGHSGHSAHIEVFDAQCRHLGEADINSGQLNPSRKVDGRKLRY